MESNQRRSSVRKRRQRRGEDGIHRRVRYRPHRRPGRQRFPDRMSCVPELESETPSSESEDYYADFESSCHSPSICMSPSNHFQSQEPAFVGEVFTDEHNDAFLSQEQATAEIGNDFMEVDNSENEVLNEEIGSYSETSGQNVQVGFCETNTIAINPNGVPRFYRVYFRRAL
jgi:hypothetical protein